MKQYYLKFLLLFVLTFTVSCAIKPVKSEYNFLDTEVETVDLNTLGNGKVLIYNAVDPFRQLGEKGSLNVWINNKPLAYLKEREYVIVNLRQNTYEFKVLHVNKVNIKNFYDIDIDEFTKVIRIEPTSLSHRINIVNEFPLGFDQFAYASQK